MLARNKLVGLVLAATLVSQPAPAPAVVADKIKHDLVVQAEEMGDDSSNKFRIYGAVSTFKGRQITIQRKVNNGTYSSWRKTRTTAARGKFSERIYGGKRGSKICYKVVVPQTKKYRTTKRAVACITTE